MAWEPSVRGDCAGRLGRIDETHGVCPDEYNADKYGEEHPSCPEPCVESIEKICGGGGSYDHRRRELKTGDVKPVISRGRREIGVKENEKYDGGLRGKVQLFTRELEVRSSTHLQDAFEHKHSEQLSSEIRSFSSVAI
jgi:hypothetical protein